MLAYRVYKNFVASIVKNVFDEKQKRNLGTQARICFWIKERINIKLKWKPVLRTGDKAFTKSNENGNNFANYVCHELGFPEAQFIGNKEEYIQFTKVRIFEIIKAIIMAFEGAIRHLF